MPESTGTITVTNGSAAVTGSGTLFADSFVGANDALVVDGDIYIVKSVSSNAALTLLTPYTGTGGSGKSYVIVHLTGEDVVNLLAKKTTELVEKYGQTVNSITETPGASKIPKAGENGKLADAWLSAAAEQKAGIAKIATASGAAAGTDDATIMTPAKVKSVLPVQATESKAGIAKIATASEAAEETDATRCITPARLSVTHDSIRCTYDGKNLTTAFAAEIAGYSSAWAWIKARMTAANYNGIMIGDYIPISFNGQTLNMQVAGIDCYMNANDTEVGHHIDFISRTVPSGMTMNWRGTNDNNGTADENAPYLLSIPYTTLNSTWLGYLPPALQSVIVEKRTLLETRYSPSGALTESNGWKWASLGKLWLPSIYEVTGTNHWGTPGHSEGCYVQYPIFQHNMKYRVKSRSAWWTSTLSGGSASGVVYVNGSGFVSSYNPAGNLLCCPVCFRIA